MNDDRIRRSATFAVFVGWLSHIALKDLLPLAVMVWFNLDLGAAPTQPDWYRYVSDPTRPFWYALQASLFVGAIVAGFVAGKLSPRLALVPGALVVLSLLSTFFEQIPRPTSWSSETIRWIGPCAGLVVGVLLGWRRRPVAH